MQPETHLNTLIRPRLLISAARHGLAEYDRHRDLRRLLGTPLPAPAAAFSRLLEMERGLECARTCGDAAYRPARHVAVLIALLGESRLLGASALGSAHLSRPTGTVTSLHRTPAPATT